MTNEEAIKWLKDYIQNTPFQMEQYERAFEMAISALNSLEEVYAKGYNDGFTQAEVNYENDKALSQEPCDDAISRQAVLDIIKSEFLSNARAYNTDTEIAISNIKTKISLLPVTRKYKGWEIERILTTPPMDYAQTLKRGR